MPGDDRLAMLQVTVVDDRVGTYTLGVLVLVLLFIARSRA
jgi:hypothetical protein